MSDLRPMFDRIAGDANAAAPTVLDADVARGRHAVHVRRTRILGAGLGLALLAGGVAFGVGQSGSAVQSTVEAAPIVQTPTLAFVSYTGEQPAGFNVAIVPDGWSVDAVDEYSLTIVPPGLNTHPQSFTGKLLVSLESLDATETPGDRVDVGGQEGFLVRGYGGGDAGQLRWTDAKGNRMYVQWPLDAKWSDREMADFAAGITVTKAAKPTRG
ncbi:MAG: hypothetical protein ACT4QF_14775 [Sporichthyaceae bacterium]